MAAETSLHRAAAAGERDVRPRHRFDRGKSDATTTHTVRAHDSSAPLDFDGNGGRSGRQSAALC
jgi:hypothetical protein